MALYLVSGSHGRLSQDHEWGNVEWGYHYQNSKMWWSILNALRIAKF